MLNFKFGWPAALRTDASGSARGVGAAGDASASASPGSGAAHGSTADTSTPASAAATAPAGTTARAAKRDRKAPHSSSRTIGVPAAVRYFAIFDPRPPSRPKDKGKGKGKEKEQAPDADDAPDEAETPPSTTVLFYSSPSEPTTTQSTIHRRLGLASAIVQFSSEINQRGASGSAPAPPSAQTPAHDLPRWSVTASKTRTLTLRVRPFVYLHVVIDLPRLPRSVSVSKHAKSKSGAPPATMTKWEYVANAVQDEPVFDAMAKGWNAFVTRFGEPPDRSERGEEDAEAELDAYHRSLEKYFMPWVLTWDIASSSFPQPPAPPADASRSISTVRSARKTSSLRKSVAGGIPSKPAPSRSDADAAASSSARARPNSVPDGSRVSSAGSTSSSSLTAALADTLRLSRKQT
ncbi:hypothetical protein OC835_000488 [Tilletia horrida]|nr:hypothetical protein OC835_000488 [Tilletia horrida]